MIDGNLCEKFLRCSREEQNRVVSMMGATVNEMKKEVLDMNDLSIVSHKYNTKQTLHNEETNTVYLMHNSDCWDFNGCHSRLFRSWICDRIKFL